MPKFTISEYADRVEVSRAYIYKLIKRKKNPIVLILDGKKKKIDSDQADPIVKFKPAGRATAKTYQKNGAKRKGKAPKDNGTPTDNSGPLKVTDDIDKITNHLQFAKAEKERIANEVKMKTLVDFNETSDTVFNFLRPLRDDLLEVSKRVSSIMYMSKSKLEAKKLLDKEIERIMLSRVGNDYKFNEDLKKKIIKILKT